MCANDGRLIDLPSQNTLPQWNIVFYINGSLQLVGLLVFTFMATSTLQSWALKKEITRQVTEDGKATKIKLPLDRCVLKRELDSPFYRAEINTNTDDWKEFKETTLVQ